MVFNGRRDSAAAALVACFLFCLSAHSPAGAAEAFARVDENAAGAARALQTAIVTYVPAEQPRALAVDLVAAIHIGDRDYYAELNEWFARYDALLYELVAPPDTVVLPETEKTGLISAAQQLLTRALDLSFQLDEIDYTGANFVHADLSSTELAASMAARNESLYSYLWRIFLAALREYARDPLGVKDWALIGKAATSSGWPNLKSILAYELASTKSIELVFGDAGDSAIIGARNERAIAVMLDRIDAGAARIGIFYGVGHMPDLEERLLELGFVRRATVWIDAWQLTATSGPSATEPN